MKYTAMPSPIYQNVIDLVVGLSLGEGPGGFVNVVIGNVVLLTNKL
jgi:hypothetical protein